MTLKDYIRNSNSFQARKILMSPKIATWLDKNGGEFVLTPKNAALMQKVLVTPGRNRSGSFSSSAAGSCLRRQMFQFIGVPQRATSDSVLKLMFIDGRVKHLVWQMICLEAGALTAIEVPITLPEYNLHGSVDGMYIKGNGHQDPYGHELKTTQAFEYFVKNGPSLAHIKQIHAYMLARPDLAQFALIYWDVRSREWHETVIERDPVMIKLIKTDLARLNNGLASTNLPPILKECINGKGPTYTQCPYAHVCLSTNSWQQATEHAHPTTPVTPIITTPITSKPAPRRPAQTKGTSVRGRQRS
jgi:hypothetical protein